MKKAMVWAALILGGLLFIGVSLDSPDGSGEPAEQSDSLAEWEEGPPDAAYLVVERRLKRFANDPGSIEITRQDCRNAGKVSLEEGHGWSLECAYRGRNTLGALVRETDTFTILIDVGDGGSVGYFAVRSADARSQ